MERPIMGLLLLLMTSTLLLPLTVAQEQQTPTVEPVSEYTVLYRVSGGLTITPIILSCQDQLPSDYNVTLKLYTIDEQGNLNTEEVDLEAQMIVEEEYCTIINTVPVQKDYTTIAGGAATVTLSYGSGESRTTVSVNIPVILADLPDLTPIIDQAGIISQNLDNIMSSMQKVSEEAQNITNLLEKKAKPAASDINSLLDQLNRNLENLNQDLNNLAGKVEELNSTIANITSTSGGGNSFLRIIALGQLALTAAVLVLVVLVFVKVRGTAEVLE